MCYVDAARCSLALMGLAVCGCDPGIRVDGVVHRPDGAPVASATVKVVCPNGGHSIDNASQSTKEDGNFSFHRLGCLSTECVVRVESGSASTESPVWGSCRKTVFACGKGCNQASFDITLKAL
jgi:hypothetical protein